MLKEKTCRYCKLIFMYEDGKDERSEEKPAFSYAYCPKCDDPNAVGPLSYEKKDILEIFVEYLVENGIEAQELDDDSVISMMQEFPQCYYLYKSNGTYRTITLQVDSKFKGRDGEFELGIFHYANIQENGNYEIRRDIKCLRCDRVTVWRKRLALEYALGLHPKLCKNCDSWERNTNGLAKGRVQSKDSDRALAKALNVSRMDFRRRKGVDKIRKRVPSLPLKTVIGSFEIISAYWDENPNVHAPRYLIECTKCGDRFRIAQKKIYDQVHYCKVAGRLIS